MPSDTLPAPDGGSPTDAEIAVCEEAERRIRALPHAKSIKRIGVAYLETTNG